MESDEQQVLDESVQSKQGKLARILETLEVLHWH